MIRVLLVDDETLLLDSLEIILSLNQMEVVAKAHDGREALEILKGTSCDIALVDLNMKGMGGIELIGKLKEQHPDVKILVLTTFYDDKNITDAIAGGADGYLLKDSGKDAILGAVRQIIGGVNVLDPKVMQRLTLLMTQNAARGAAGAAQGEPAEAKDKKTLQDLPELTEREKEICALMVDGLDNKQIAKRLYISEGTVKNYISGIYDKTGIHDRVKLIVELRG
ncbi:MAG: response regulator transcription factor [Lachnospiraceae bacterium]|nr:response regulator transcription factor [Lachnospiraceae bacterium]